MEASEVTIGDLHQKNILRQMEHFLSSQETYIINWCIIKWVHLSNDF